MKRIPEIIPFRRGLYILMAAVLLQAVTAGCAKEDLQPGAISIRFQFDELGIDLNIVDNPYITCVVNSETGLERVSMFIEYEDGSEVMYKEPITDFYNPKLCSIYERPVYEASMTGFRVEAEDIGGGRAEGAVLLDEQYREIEAFKTLVKPQYNDVIGAYYTRLTGITTEMVENAPVFEMAFQKFFGWLHSVDDDIEIYQWSDTDLDQVTKEINLKHIQIDTEDQPLIHNWYNLQKEYGEKLNLTKSVISAYENALRLPSYDVLIQIAKLFHVSTDYLLGLETPAGLDLSGLTEEEKTCIRNLIQAMKHRK